MSAEDLVQDIVRASDDAEPRRRDALHQSETLGGRQFLCEPQTIARAKLFGRVRSSAWITAHPNDLVDLEEVR